MVNKVFSSLGRDKDFISGIASMYIMVGELSNPDDEDYLAQLENTALAVPFLLQGEMRVDTCKQGNLIQALAEEVFSHEIKSHRTFDGLTNMYKRLKSSPNEIPSVVFQNIVRKMFWLYLQEESVIA